MADHDDAIDALVGGLAQLNVQEQLRPSNDIAFPPHSTVYAILLLIKEMTNCSDSTTRGILRNSCSFFWGTSYCNSKDLGTNRRERDLARQKIRTKEAPSLGAALHETISRFKYFVYYRQIR